MTRKHIIILPSHNFWQRSCLQGAVSGPSVFWVLRIKLCSCSSWAYVAPMFLNKNPRDSRIEVTPAHFLRPWWITDNRPNRAAVSTKEEKSFREVVLRNKRELRRTAGQLEAFVPWNSEAAQCRILESFESTLTFPALSNLCLRLSIEITNFDFRLNIWTNFPFSFALRKSSVGIRKCGMVMSLIDNLEFKKQWVQKQSPFLSQDLYKTETFQWCQQQSQVYLYAKSFLTKKKCFKSYGFFSWNIYCSQGQKYKKRGHYITSEWGFCAPSQVQNKYTRYFTTCHHVLSAWDFRYIYM